MKKKLLIMVCAFLPLGLMAQEQGAYPYYDEEVSDEQSARPAETSESNKSKSKNSVFTGFTGGMMIHGGYLFTDDPRKLFSNSGLGDEAYVNSLPKHGFTFGLGGALRMHLKDKIHLGAEGFVSTLPLMGTGSSIRTGWGGVLCDVYTNWGKVRPMIGITLGGGSMRRLYVPGQTDKVNYAVSDSIYYNASYTQTPFFFMDPYVGLEVALKAHTALLIRVDYMLPFGKQSSKLTDNVKWSNFMSPTGPRLYVGFMFGKFNKTKI